jgi:hypothetical protein
VRLLQTSLYPQNASFHYRLARALCGLGRIDEGREALALGLALDPDYRRFALDEPVFSGIWEEFAGVED